MKFFIDMQDWKKAVKHVKQALSGSGAIGALKYIKYEIQGQELKLVGLNNHMLNTYTVTIQKENPSKYVEFLDFVAPIPDIGKGEILNVSIEENQILFTTENATIIVPRIEMEFINWKNLISANRNIAQIYMRVEVFKKAISGLPNDAIIGINIGDVDQPILLGNEGSFSLVAPYAMPEHSRFSLNP